MPRAARHQPQHLERRSARCCSAHVQADVGAGAAGAHRHRPLRRALHRLARPATRWRSTRCSMPGPRRCAQRRAARRGADRLLRRPGPVRAARRRRRAGRRPGGSGLRRRRRHGRFAVVTGGERWRPMLERLAACARPRRARWPASTPWRRAAPSWRPIRRARARCWPQACREAARALRRAGRDPRRRRAWPAWRPTSPPSVPVPLIDSVSAGARWARRALRRAAAAPRAGRLRRGLAERLVGTRGAG